MLEKYKYETRLEKAQKIKSVLLDYLAGAQDPQQLSCLDLGCSIGVISDYLSHIFGSVIGVDLSVESLHVAHQLHAATQAKYMHGSGLRLPFRDCTFDVIVCAQVYEHSIDPHQLVAEIYRVLKPGGLVFFSGPNRWWPYEYHYRWLFLHWLPRSMLHRYCQKHYGHRFDLVLYDYWQLTTLWKTFERYDYTLKLIYEAERFWSVPTVRRWAHIVPRPLAHLLRFLLPNFNWLLVKPNEL